jgi:hypothetical protein
MVMPIQFQFNREVDNDFVHYIMQTACEGGSIEYWCNPDLDSNDEYQTFDGEHIIEIRIIVEDEPVPGFAAQQTIDGSVIREGIKRLLTGEVNLNAGSLGTLLYGIINDETDDIDGELVDSIVQAGLYNDIVFG